VKLFFILFVVLPVAELMILIKVGGLIGILPTVGLILSTAFIGATMLRRQGIETLMRANQRLQEGQIPAVEVFQGFLLALGGAFLLTPGFITDALGFALLLPRIRASLGRHLMRSMANNSGVRFYSGFESGFEPASQSAYQPEAAAGTASKSASQQEIIEGEFEEVSDLRHLDDKNRSKS
jgi:UPF0716 protein FxsA